VRALIQLSARQGGSVHVEPTVQDGSFTIYSTSIKSSSSSNKNSTAFCTSVVSSIVITVTTYMVRAVPSWRLLLAWLLGQWVMAKHLTSSLVQQVGCYHLVCPFLPSYLSIYLPQVLAFLVGVMLFWNAATGVNKGGRHAPSPPCPPKIAATGLKGLD
jgi:hypothetical protein